MKWTGSLEDSRNWSGKWKVGSVAVTVWSQMTKARTKKDKKEQ